MTLSKELKRYLRNSFGSYENFCMLCDESIARLSRELQEYSDNHSKGGDKRKVNIRMLQEDIKRIKEQKTEYREAFPTKIQTI